MISVEEAELTIIASITCLLMRVMRKAVHNFEVFLPKENCNVNLIMRKLQETTTTIKKISDLLKQSSSILNKSHAMKQRKTDKLFQTKQIQRRQHHRARAGLGP